MQRTSAGLLVILAVVGAGLGFLLDQLLTAIVVLALYLSDPLPLNP